MSFSSRLNFPAWIIVPLCALGFLLITDYRRIQRVDSISNNDREDAIVDPSSPTGYADGKRWLIVPEHNYHSYQWIAEAQQMLARKEWRVRRIDYENAPAGREVHSASPYRWWLGLIAWCDHSLSGRSPGLAVERAALIADPLLHLLFLLTTTLSVARRFGGVAAGLVSLAIATLFPLATAFLPGVPDHYGLAEICALWSVLPLIAAAAETPPTTVKNKAAPDPEKNPRIQRRRARDFFLAGVAGGLGLWISVANQVPVLLGITLGGLFAAGITRARRGKSTEAAARHPWGIWALGGATTSLLAYFIEYFPAHLDFKLEVNHPLYGVAWIGIGGLLTITEARLSDGKAPWRWTDSAALLTAFAAISAMPVAMVLSHTRAFLVVDLLDSRLTHLAGGASASSLSAWLSHDGFTTAFAGTLLPLLLLVPALWLLARRKTTTPQRSSLAIALGPVLVALGFACDQLRWWNFFDCVLLALLIAVSSILSAEFILRHVRWWVGAAGFVFLCGLIPLVGTTDKDALSRLDVESLIERGLAHWISDHTGSAGAVFLAPPDRTASLCFFGGLRGLGTPSWENQEGLAATARIVSATTPEIAQTLLGERGITYIVLPSWDVDLDELTRLTSTRLEDSFLNALHHWSLPPWIRALPYKLPSITGFERQSVALFEVTDENNRAAALSRAAEYFVEMEQMEPAAAAVQTLQRYPSDLGALVAIAQVQKATSDPNFNTTFQTIISNLAGGFDRALAWDQRVSLAVVLAQGERTDLAREQLKRCLDKMDDTKLRSLTTGSLFRLQVLGRAFNLPITDDRLRGLALKLLPPELRSRL